MKENKGMTINEVAHYWHVNVSDENNVIRIGRDEVDAFFYWNAETGES